MIMHLSRSIGKPALPLDPANQQPEIHGERRPTCLGLEPLRRHGRDIHRPMPILVGDVQEPHGTTCIPLQQPRDGIVADAFADEVQHCIVCRPPPIGAEGFDKEGGEIVNVRKVHRAARVPHHGDLVAGGIGLRPGTPDGFAVLVVELAAADERVGHDAGEDGRVLDGGFIGEAFLIPNLPKKEKQSLSVYMSILEKGG
ncbi:hypothetical protein VTN31DRAFT_1160 [Thermomyces dupontii]|uniref:uncharacterized protein n=1 Tax=Talaromyces thermophilus TaxID=28565 RepID=UPI0037443E8C